MELLDHDIYKGPVRERVTYTIPNHPYLSLTVHHSRELDVDLKDITEEMIIDSGTLTAEDLFMTRGLRFCDDSVLWAALAEKVSVEFQRRGKTTMDLSAFMSLLERLTFEDETSVFYRLLTKCTALAHFSILEYIVDGEKRDTISAHFNRLLELLDSLFLQFLMLRNRSESNTLLTLFDILPNPKEIYGDAASPTSVLLKHFLSDHIFVAYASSYRFVSSVLCSCDQCRASLFRIYLGKKDSRAVHISDISEFDPADLILGQLHLDACEAVALRAEIDRDLGSSLILNSMERRHLPILHDKQLGRGHFERNILKVYCNIILCLFLLRRVKQRIVSDLTAIARFFVKAISEMERCIDTVSGLRGVRIKLLVVSSQFEIKDPMRVPRLCFFFLEIVAILVSGYDKERHRVRALLEHLCLKKICLGDLCASMRLAREIRHDVLEGFLNTLELSYMSNPVRFFRFHDCNLYGTHMWSGVYPNVVPYAVRGGGSFDIRLQEHRRRQKRIVVRRRLIRRVQQRGLDIREARRVPKPACVTFI
uniref:U4 n=2 Tax=Roseolovirus TaxID=40272 RepID=A0A4P8DZ29_9BETA|nr:hypothetical protein [Human betaherpesvirus 6]QCO43323.1 U4 [Human betaherpesvirus 6A]QCO43407.1 U4 [Human betaherpesvirus 6A]